MGARRAPRAGQPGALGAASAPAVWLPAVPETSLVRRWVRGHRGGSSRNMGRGLWKKCRCPENFERGTERHEGAAVRGSGVKRRTCAFQVLFLSSSGESGPGQRDGGAGRASGWPGVSTLQRGRSPVPVGAGFRPPLSGAREAELGFLRALALPSEPSEGAEGRSKGAITMTEPKFEEEMLSVLKLKKTIFDCRRHTASLVSGVRQGRDVCTAHEVTPGRQRSRRRRPILRAGRAVPVAVFIPSSSHSLTPSPFSPAPPTYLASGDRLCSLCP